MVSRLSYTSHHIYPKKMTHIYIYYANKFADTFLPQQENFKQILQTLRLHYGAEKMDSYAKKSS